ncbi:hypothetical protein FT639_30645 [Bacillus mycoides]|nr:hypothetical protein [Bacillus mycoides]
MGIKQKAVKIIKVLVNKADSGARIKQLKKALLHYLCSKAFFLAYEIAFCWRHPIAIKLSLCKVNFRRDCFFFLKGKCR